jgi:hypothetical protein
MKALNVNKLTKCGVTFKFWYDMTHTDCDDANSAHV